MDNLKCFSDHVSTHASVDFIDARETLRKELLKSKETQAWVLVSGDESKKKGVRGFGACTWSC